MIHLGFDYFATRDPDALALVDPGGRRWRRGELFTPVCRLSRALRSAGLTRGDVLAIVSPNCAEYMIVYLAATQVGLYVLPLNWHLTAEELAYIVEDSCAKALVTHESLTSLAQQVMNRLPLAPPTRVSIGRSPGFFELEEFIAGHSSAALTDPDFGRMMLYTSATTGRPKGISLPLSDSRSALERTIQLHIAGGTSFEGGNAHLSASMLYHAAPLDGAAIALHMGHVLVLVDRIVPVELLQLIETLRVTVAYMVPTVFARLLRLPEEVRRAYSVASLRRVVHTGAACPTEVKRQMIEWWGPIIWDAYGAAEGAGTIVNSHEWLKYPGTVGRPMPGSRLKILSEAGEELAPGQVGLIYYSRYTGDRFEYRGDPAKTQAAYRGDLFTVGDLGYVNEDGYLYLCDRKTDMIISSGTNIYSAEIERVLIMHPNVEDCAVFGVPDDLLGEAVHAVVQPSAGVEPDAALTRELRQFLRGRLALTKTPRRIEYMAELPRDPSGKLFKRRLREPHWQRQPSHLQGARPDP